MKSRINELLDRLFPFRVRHREQVALCNIQRVIIEKYQEMVECFRVENTQLKSRLAAKQAEMESVLHLNHANAAQHRFEQIQQHRDNMKREAEMNHALGRKPDPEIDEHLKQPVLARPGQHLNSPTPK